MITTDQEIDLKSIATFCALGFFLEDDSYYKNNPVPSKKLNGRESIIKYKWSYNPKDRKLESIVEEFENIFDQSSKKIYEFDRVILPLSGGLDSRTQAVYLSSSDKKVNAFTYQFPNGIQESVFGKEISEISGFKFSKYVIPEGYLWNKIELLAKWNHCESEFTHPRQMAIESQFPEMGDVFYLGHWGDVLFDTIKIDERSGVDKQVSVLKSKIVKKGGLELANALWVAWDMGGTFETYLNDRLYSLLNEIKIDHAGAKLRAFKSLHWLPRWTLENLCVFEQHHPVVLPYCNTTMFDYITTISEEILADRRIQIEYIKKNKPALAKVSWQPYRPYNLYNYEQFRSFRNYPRRIYNKVFNTLRNKKIVERNWEIQFLGEENDLKLKKWLFENPKFSDFIDPKITKKVYENFCEKDSVHYSHPLSILLTLSVFAKKFLIQ